MNLRRLVLLALLCSLGLVGQQKRPKIGLVLEGGGALGFAHIGVLEWMEKNRVPVDAIAGTSMGGLIGGLYAAGYTPTQIREIAKNADWQELLGGATNFQDLAYRRKEDRLAYPTRLELGLKGGLVLPAGLNEGHAIGLLLSRSMAAYPEMKSFDELPTPFRCVATDLVSGGTRVFDSGYLGEALRSTMSLPAVFSPVRKDQGIFVDGGLLNNLPVDVARKMGVDLVVAVHLNKGPVDPKKITSLVDVMGRSISVVVGAAEMRTIQTADVVLVADLASYSTTDYTKNQEIADAGVTAAEVKANLLRRFALDESVFAEHVAERQRRVKRAVERPQFVEVTGAGVSNDAAVRQRLERLVRERGTGKDFERELTQIVGLGRLASIHYAAVERNGQVGVRAIADAKPSGPIFVLPLVEVNGIDTSNTRFSVAARITWLDFWGFRSEWRNDVSFGARFAAISELYKPLRPNSRLFFAPRAYVDSNYFDVYERDAVVAEYRLRNQGLGFDTGMNLNRFSEIRLGYAFNWIAGERRVGLPLLNEFALRRDAVSLRYNFEGQDDYVVARRGTRLNARIEYFPDQGNLVTNYGIGEVRWVHYAPISKQNSLVTGLSAGGAVGPLRSAFLTYSLGGPQRLGAYGVNEIQARNFLLSTFGVLHEMKSQPSLFGSKVYLTGFAQAARVTNFDRTNNLPLSATGAVVLKSLIGPVFLGGSLGDAGHRRWFFGVGRFF
jgi:NTE family protein